MIDRYYLDTLHWYYVITGSSPLGPLDYPRYELFQGTAGNDLMRGSANMDHMFGAAGNDLMFGNGGDDQLHGGRGNDRLQGGNGGDALWGDAGTDILLGQAGDDQLEGGPGHDVLVGGAGNDIFMFGQAGAANWDRITDYQPGRDHIFLDLSTATEVPSELFCKNTTGHAESYFNRIIYETDTGWLNYDPNGDAPGGEVHLALLNPHLALTAGDFW